MRICRGIKRSIAKLARPHLWLLLVLAIVAAGCEHPLPQANSYPAKLYANRCGRCHTPYQPHSLAPGMWKAQVAMMQQRMQRAGVEPLTPEQKKIILGYLKRNAGGE